MRVLGVSPDPVKLVKKFHDKQALNFTLLADEDHAVCDAYGVWAEKSMYGKTYWGALRATFIIDGEGVIRHVIPKVSPKTHDDEVLAAVGAPRGASARRTRAASLSGSCAKATPAFANASRTWSSRTDPDVAKTALTPASSRVSGASGNGKNESL